MPDQHQHQPEVLAFLQRQFPNRRWTLEPPRWGRGRETYIASGGGERFFIKLNTCLGPYQAMAEAGLTPPLLFTGRLPSGIPFLVQTYLAARSPSWGDFQFLLDEFAAVVQRMQRSPQVRQALPQREADTWQQAALAARARLVAGWQARREQVPQAARLVDDALEELAEQIQSFSGSGLVPVHNDICNANWLVTPVGKIYLVDLDDMALDDPAQDLGALLWWYYPPALRPRFLQIAGIEDDEALRQRMRVRMAMHCLHILLPRENSFDRFVPEAFSARLDDFQAVMNGRENPHGYHD